MRGLGEACFASLAGCVSRRRRGNGVRASSDDEKLPNARNSNMIDEIYLASVASKYNRSEVAEALDGGDGGGGGRDGLLSLNRSFVRLCLSRRVTLPPSHRARPGDRSCFNFDPRTPVFSLRPSVYTRQLAARVSFRHSAGF